jgi:hypothetical protein
MPFQTVLSAHSDQVSLFLNLLNIHENNKGHKLSFDRKCEPLR